MKLLTTENAKTVKGESLGYLTGILYLAPARESGVRNVCPYATEECRAACLFTAGRGNFESVRQARIRKTVWLHKDRKGFLKQLRLDIGELERKASKLGLTPAIRLNGTSDLADLAATIAAEFPQIQFYDYTKIPAPWKRVRANYHVTFSYSGHNMLEALEALEHGVNVAVVFDTKRGMPLPATWNGYRVVDGDVSDLRFRDESGVVVGLRAKGRARRMPSAFVSLSPTPLVQIRRIG